MSERMEWRVVCVDGDERSHGWIAGRLRKQQDAAKQAEHLDATGAWGSCGPHRVQSRTVSTSEWADTDVTE